MKYQDLKILDELREKGSISEEEYQREKEKILNAMISYLLYAVVLIITVIGVPVAIILGIAVMVFVIIAAVKANNGEFWKYPFIIQFIKFSDDQGAVN